MAVVKFFIDKVEAFTLIEIIKDNMDKIKDCSKLEDIGIAS